MAGLAVQMAMEFAEEPSPVLLVTQVRAFAVIPQNCRYDQKHVEELGKKLKKPPS